MSRREALDFLCGVISVDQSPELQDQLRRSLQSGTVPWTYVVAIASEQWVSSAVWPALSRKSLQDEKAKSAIDYFEGMATLNRQRNAKLRSEAIELTRMLNVIDVRPVFLKGCASLLSNLYPDTAMRMMLDIDALVPAERVSACASILQANGYTQLCDTGFPAHHHYPPLGRPGAVASIELHVEPLDIQYRRFLAAAEVRDHAVELSVEGASLAVPSRQCQLLHCIAHAQFSDHAFIYGLLPLRDLLETAYLSRSNSIDWTDIFSRFVSRGERTAVAFHLAAAERLLGGPPTPGDSRAGALASLRRAKFQAAHPALQRCIEMALRPCLLLRRSLSHPSLRRRLLRSLADPSWRSRQWRMLRGDGG